MRLVAASGQTDTVTPGSRSGWRRAGRFSARSALVGARRWGGGGCAVRPSPTHPTAISTIEGAT